MIATITDDFDLRLEWPSAAAVLTMSLCSRSEVVLSANVVQTQGLTYQDLKRAHNLPDFHKRLTPSERSKFIARAKARLSRHRADQ